MAAEGGRILKDVVVGTAVVVAGDVVDLGNGVDGLSSVSELEGELLVKGSSNI